MMRSRKLVLTAAVLAAVPLALTGCGGGAGGGGDNVFCALQSAAPVADRLLTDGPGRGFFSTARAIAILCL